MYGTKMDGRMIEEIWPAEVFFGFPMAVVADTTDVLLADVAVEGAGEAMRCS